MKFFFFCRSIHLILPPVQWPLLPLDIPAGAVELKKKNLCSMVYWPISFPHCPQFHVRTFKAGSKPDQVVSKIGLEEITKDQILSLEGLSWLKDNVINCYMALLMKRSEDSGGTLPKVYGFNTFFHTALNDHGYSRVKRWTKKVKTGGRCVNENNVM